MKSRLEFKFPTLYKWRSNSFPPGQEKASNFRGKPVGGMFKLRFDWYIMFVCDNIPMSSTRKYRQNGVDINKTLLNEKRKIVMKHFEFSYFVSI